MQQPLRSRSVEKDRELITPDAAVLAGPIFIIAGILFYFDLRVRKEGYSLEKLSEELGIKPVT